MLVRPDAGFLASWSNNSQRATNSNCHEPSRARSALSEISPNNLTPIGNVQGVRVQNPSFGGAVICKDIVKVSSAPISRPLTANSASVSHVPQPHNLQAAGRGLVLASKIHNEKNVLNLSQGPPEQIFYTESRQTTPTFTFPNVAPIVRKRRKTTARKAAVAFGYNPLLSPIVEDRFAEAPSPVRVAALGSDIPLAPFEGSVFQDDGSELLVETESAAAGERVIISAQFASRPFFQKYNGKIGPSLIRPPFRSCSKFPDLSVLCPFPGTLLRRSSSPGGGGWLADFGEAGVQVFHPLLAPRDRPGRRFVFRAEDLYRRHATIFHLVNRRHIASSGPGV